MLRKTESAPSVLFVCFDLLKRLKRKMDARETLIHRITQELHQLPEEYLDTIFRVVDRMRTQLTNGESSEQATPPEAFPFVDEIERVREQSRRKPGRGEDRQFT